MLSFIEISCENLKHNFEALKNYVNRPIKTIAVIKANAYGCGQNEVANILEPLADYFALDDLDELRQLRKVSQKTVLLLGYVPKEDLKEAVELGAILVIYDLERARILDELAKEKKRKIKIHVKIDAFLGRQGILTDEAENFSQALSRFEHLEVEALYGHFSDIEDTDDFSHAQKQIENFEKAVEVFRQNGFAKVKTHLSATSGILVWEKQQGRSDFVRLGIGLYGLWPSQDLKQKFGGQIYLKPVLRWISRIAQVKILPKGFPIGYGLTFVTKKETKIAVVPQGYSDGFDRGFSNCGEVLIGGKKCSILGRVMMNMFVVDVSHLKKVEVEDEVVLLGFQGSEEITAEEMAEKIGTINYEIMARISPLLTKKVV